MSKNPGRIVKTKSNKRGIVYDKDMIYESLLKGKVPVNVIDGDLQLTGEQILCLVENMSVVGFVD